MSDRYATMLPKLCQMNEFYQYIWTVQRIEYIFGTYSAKCFSWVLDIQKIWQKTVSKRFLRLCFKWNQQFLQYQYWEIWTADIAFTLIMHTILACLFWLWYNSSRNHVIHLSVFFGVVKLFHSYRGYRPISYIPQCNRQISHNALFCNRNVHTCTHFCYKMVHRGIWDWYMVGYGTAALWDCEFGLFVWLPQYHWGNPDGCV